MNKLIKRTAAAFLTQAMLLSAFAWAEDPQPTEVPAEEAAQQAAEAELADDTLIMTVNGMEYTVSDFKNAAGLMYSNNYTSAPDDYALAYTYLTQDALFRYAASKYGLDQYTDEDRAAFRETAQADWDAAVESYVAYYKTGTETEEELATLTESANAYWTAAGYSIDGLVEQIELSQVYTRVEEYVKTTYGIDVTDEEVLNAYNALIESEKTNFEGNAMMYELYQYYYQYEPHYVPEGYRGVLQILLQVDETLLNDYTTKLAAYEEQLSAEEAEAAEGEAAAEATEAPAEEVVPVTAEDVEAARAAVLASVQDKIDEIYARLANGESFIDLIPEYNIDPGMQDESNLANGYLVHKDSIIYDPVFVGAAFDENMNAVGDVSEPALGSYGVYIVYYLRDAAGAAELTDEYRSQLADEVLAEKLNAKYTELIAEWQSESTFVYEEGPFTALTGLVFVDGQVTDPSAVQ